MQNMRVRSRRSFLQSGAAGLGGLTLAPALAPVLHLDGREERPNILWLIAEDLCPELGCYGHELVQTPNLDRLAAEGMRLTSAFTTAPVCSPSRSAFMTGRYQTSIGVHQHRTISLEPLPDGVEVITEPFRRAGYFTANCGRGEWDRRGKTDFNFAGDWPFDGTDWRQRAPGQPFFVQVNFSETHRAFSRDPERPIDPDAIELPPYYPDHPVTRRDWADYLECVQVLDRRVGLVLRRLEADGLADETIVFFFADHGRPHVRGKQFLYDGGIHVPLIIRWPGRIAAGGVSDALVSAIDLGPTCMALVGIAPAAGLEGRVFMAGGSGSGGGSVADRGRELIVAARDRCDETVDRIRCVRDQRFTYIRNCYPHLPWTQPNLYKLRQYPVLTLMQLLYARGELTPEQARFMAPDRPPEELYDLAADPHQLRNLTDEPAHAGTLALMRTRLDDWIVETGDRGEIPEDPAVAARVYLERHRPEHAEIMRRRGLSPDVSPAAYLHWWEEQLGVERSIFRS